MRVAFLLLTVVVVAAASSAQPQDGPDQRREKREMAFRPMFVTRERNRLRAEQAELRRRVAVVKQQRRQQSSRRSRALQFPVAGEPGMALKVAVNDLLFQSAPANDLPDAQGPWRRKGALRPLLLAKLRAAQLSADRRMDSDVVGQEADGEEAEGFLLLSANGGRPAIVPAPATGSPMPAMAPAPALKSKEKGAAGKSSKRSPYSAHKRVTRDATPQQGLGNTLLDMFSQGASADAIASMVGERARVSERVKQYDMQGTYPSYSYNHGRYTRAAPQIPPTPAKDVKLKVKVSGVDDDEDLETAQSVVFRPLFVHREREAAKQLRRADKKRWLAQAHGLPVKKAGVKPLKRPGKVRGYPAPARYPQRRYSQHRPKYYFSPYRRVVYYH